ncbi:hypothetical protein GCM10012275_05250 [Longimycelium tulufanense]|uniref:DUF3048 domain-containing protein n=1 Tax=Longimycelium tulufanense TaxID=907463 RepID=A0A8J3C7R7_9PSEU|nr:DUF3048 domain-containing protein [Longimycelium tulufanense]GGM37050.1 hypothetical protein GCM10012275_05250 [Longimycelium tulufanense]
MAASGLGRTVTGLAAAVGLVAALLGCSRDGEPQVSPFTGRTVTDPSPVLAVKVDNVPVARPPTGLSVADLVYVEPVEGGASRLLAVFSAQRPQVVGPVRSARESDIELLASFGRPALGYSGSAPELADRLRDSSLVLLTPERTDDAFFRSDDRAAPHNLYGRPERLLAAARDASKPRDIGLRFGPAPAGGQPTTSHDVAYSATRMSFDWQSGSGRWLVSFDGQPLTLAEGGQAVATTVVVQRVAVRQSAISDVLGLPSPVAQTIGSGDAVVLRDGMSYQARWSRNAADAGTSFTLPSGDPALLATGPVWIVLAPA